MQNEDKIGSEHTEVKRLLKLLQATAAVLSEECVLVDDLDPEQAACIPALAMLANQSSTLNFSCGPWIWRRDVKKFSCDQDH